MRNGKHVDLGNCIDPACPAVTLAEQTLGFTSPYVPRTAALTNTLTAIAFSLVEQDVRAGPRSSTRTRPTASTMSL
jgi:hypothetical protein